MNNEVALAFDNPQIPAPLIEELSRHTRLYVIFIIARSGSTWLTEMARNSGVLGTPQEWFNEGWVHSRTSILGYRPPQTKDAEAFIRKIVNDYRSPHGIMGIELSAYQTRCIAEMIEQPDNLLSCVTPFYLRRENIVAQAISLYRSAAAGVFHSYQSKNATQQLQRVNYDSRTIENYCNMLLGNEIYFDRMFRRAKISPAQFTYEDIVRDPSGVLTWMAQSVEPGKRHRLNAQSWELKKLGNWVNLEWERRFRQERPEFLHEMGNRRPPVRSDLPLTRAHPAFDLAGAAA